VNEPVVAVLGLPGFRLLEVRARLDTPPAVRSAGLRVHRRARPGASATARRAGV